MSDLSGAARPLLVFQTVVGSGVRGGGQLNAKDTAHMQFGSAADDHSSKAMQPAFVQHAQGPASKASNTRSLQERAIEGLKNFARRHKHIPGQIGKVLLSIAEAGVKLVPRLIGLVLGGLLGATAGTVNWARFAELFIQEVEDWAVKDLGNTSINKDSEHPKNNQWSDVNGTARVKAQAAMCLAAVGAPLILTFLAAHKGKEVADDVVDATGRGIRDACLAVANAVAKARGNPGAFSKHMQKSSSKNEE